MNSSEPERFHSLYEEMIQAMQYVVLLTSFIVVQMT
jgi:hypothetical protein